jgi:hypothetical protein
MDDDVTQSATRLLLKVDRELKGTDAEIHDAAEAALSALLRVQYPTGAWSAYFDGSSSAVPSEQLYRVVSAKYPADWPRKWPKDFTGCYVLNDNLHATAMQTLLLSDKPEAQAAARRAGDFLLRAQMPDPQPAWAQQYDAQMQPVWSRAFEPTSICGRESQAVMWSLIRLAEATGEKKYLEPLPRAVAYLRKSLLPNGKVARFYEVMTNKPLYFVRGKESKGFELSYDGRRASSNYGWEWPSELDALEAAHAAVMAGQKVQYPKVENQRFSLPPTDAEVDMILAEFDPVGAWIEKGGTIRDASAKKVQPAGGVLHADTFVQNVRALAAWLRK